MELFLKILAFLPIVLWGFGGFRMNELRGELPKVVTYYVFIGVLYLIFV